MAIKFILVAVLAVFAAQCESAELPKSQTALDLRVFVENGAVLTSTLFKSFNEALDKVKPNSDAVLNELSTDLRTALQGLLDKGRAKVNEEEKRFAEVFAALTKALDNLEPTKPCFDEVAVDAKSVAFVFEGDLLKVVRQVLKDFDKELSKLKEVGEKTLTKARKLFDTEVVAFVKCLQPGNANAVKCVDTELKKTLQGVLEVVNEVLVLSESANHTLQSVLEETVGKLLPVGLKALAGLKDLLDTYTTCVAKMK